MKKLLLFLSLTLLLCNCKKTEAVSPALKAETLTKQVWKISKYVIGTPARQTVQYSKDGTGTFFDISKITFTFKSDGTLIDTDYLGNPTNQTWKFVNNDTQIELKNTTTGTINIVNVDALDDSQLILRKVYTQADTPATKWTELTTTMKSLGYGIGLTEIFITQSFTH
jgi:hypothetical protein